MPYELKMNPNEQICVVNLKDQSIATTHSHNFLEFAYIVSGTATHHFGDCEVELCAGDYFVVDYYTSHGYISRNKDLEIINCMFLPEFIDSYYKNEISFNQLAEKYYFRITGRKINGPTSNQIFKGSEKTGRLFNLMLEEYNAKKEGYTQILKLLLCQIIIETIRYVGSKQNISPCIESIINEINNRYTSKISLNDFCLKMNYSLPYLSKKFKEETGDSFTEYVQNLRIEESCRLLRETDMSVIQISEQVGYSSIKFFNSVFKKVVKMTPREYRKSISAFG